MRSSIYQVPGRKPIRPEQLRKPANKVRLLLYIAIGVIVVGFGIALLLALKKTPDHKTAPSQQQTLTPEQRKQQEQTATSDINKKLHSNDDPSSIWVVVNKPRELKPKTYVPNDLTVPSVPLRVPGNESMQLRKEAAGALEKLISDAKTAGYDLMLSSGYRSYDYQVGLYGGYVKSIGAAEADKTSARPGHSEHQTGLAVDVEPTSKKCELDVCFGELPEGKWVAANAYKYGFIVRYTADKVTVTGYQAEPWHLRYVGTDLSEAMRRSNVSTLEEFFDLPGGAQY